MPHLSRKAFDPRHPCHVTVRVREDVPSLRRPGVVKAIRKSWRRACDRGDFRLVHYSIQGNHVHLIVEAHDTDALARGMNALGARLAKAVNRIVGRAGRVLEDRFHHVVLRSPRQVRNALAYVLLNARRHLRKRAPAGIDPASSGAWFDGWRRVSAAARDPAGVAPPRSWLLAKGWRRHGLIDPASVPGNG